MTHRFKGLDLIECLKKYGQRLVTLYSDQDHPEEKDPKMQNDCLRRPYKRLRTEEKQKAKGKKKNIPI